VDSTKVEN